MSGFDDSSPVPLPPLNNRAADVVDAQGRVQACAPLGWRRLGLWQTVLGQMPLVLMLLLALVTWWLVRSTPEPTAETVASAPKHEPDYEMRGFSVQHYERAGPARGVIEGDKVQHFPDTDTLEIDSARVRWTDQEGHHLHATAARALVDGDGRQVRLIGGAQVRREALEGERAPLEFSSEELVFDRQADQVRSDRQVRLRQGSSQIEARSLVYDHATARLALQGAVHGTVPARH